MIPKHKIEKAAGIDESRPKICRIHIDGKNGQAYATNGYIIARVPCHSEDGDEYPSYSIYIDDLKVIREIFPFRKHRGRLEVEVDDDGNLIAGFDGVQVSIQGADVEIGPEQFATIMARNTLPGPDIRQPDAVLDIRYLRKLSKAIVDPHTSHPAICLWLGRTRSEPVIVKGTFGDGGTGMIMPVEMTEIVREAICGPLNRDTVIASLVKAIDNEDEEVTITGSLLASLRMMFVPQDKSDNKKDNL